MPTVDVSKDKKIVIYKRSNDWSGYIDYSLQVGDRVSGTISIKYESRKHHATKTNTAVAPMGEEHWEIDFDTQMGDEHWLKHGPEFQKWFVNNSDEKALPASASTQWAPFNAFVAKAMLFREIAEKRPASINWLYAERWF